MHLASARSRSRLRLVKPARPDPGPDTLAEMHALGDDAELPAPPQELYVNLYDLTSQHIDAVLCNDLYGALRVAREMVTAVLLVYKATIVQYLQQRGVLPPCSHPPKSS